MNHFLLVIFLVSFASIIETAVVRVEQQWNFNIPIQSSVMDSVSGMVL